MPSELQIRQMGLQDIQAMKEIEETSFPLPYSTEIWERERQNSLSRTLVVIGGKDDHAPELCGYLNFWLILDEAEIHRIAVKEEYRRSGIAASMIREMFHMLRRLEIATVHLEVRQSNHGAIKLYEKLGFMIKGRRQGYYEETGEDALILEADVKKTEEAGTIRHGDRKHHI